MSPFVTLRCSSSRFFRPLLALMLLWCALAPARATVTTFHTYRLGDDDNRTSPPTVTKDRQGTFDLTRGGGTNVRYGAINSAEGGWWSEFYNGGYRGPTPISTLTDNFGLEAWIYILPSPPAGARCIAYNGNTGGDGWGLCADGNTVFGFYGGIGNIGPASVPTSTWTHVALVRNNGNATLYVNGVASGSAGSAPRTATSVFAIGIRPQSDGEYFYGYIDEVRFFAFSAGQFVPGDLQLNAPEISLFAPSGIQSGATVDFGTAAAGTTTSRTWTLGNYGRGALTTNMSIIGPDAASFQVVPPSASLPGSPTSAGSPSTLADFTVKFVPQGGGPRTATLRIVNNDVDEGTFDVVLTGTGTGSPEIDVQQPAGTSRASGNSSVDLGAITVGNTSAATTFTIRDTNPAELKISSVTVTGGNASNFAMNTTGLLTTVPGNSQTTFTVTFTPSGNGPKSTTLRILNDDPNESPYDITLTGTGLGPEIAVFSGAGTVPANERFDNVGSFALPTTLVGNRSAAQTFTIQNAGATTLNLGTPSLGGANPSDFSCDSAFGGSGLAPGQTTTFTVSFAPTARGARNATVLIPTNDEDESQFRLNLNATGVAPQITIEQIPGAPLTPDGVVFAWGTNTFGQATPPAGLTNVQAVASGGNFSMALRTDGSVVAWGANHFGQATVPAAAASGVVAIAAGDRFGLVLKADGTVVAWGEGSLGQTSLPAAATTGVKAIAAGDAHGVALKNDGTVIAWGWNASGQTNVPAGLTGVQAISAKGGQTAVVKSDGTVLTWGQSYTPPAGLSGVRSVSAGGSHALALKNDNTLVGWGSGSDASIVPAAAATNIQAAAAGSVHNVVLKTDGTVLAWGDNTFGQINVPATLLKARAVSASSQNSMAIASGPAACGHQVIGLSVSTTLTIKNTGLDPLTVSGASLIGGNVGEFALSGGPSFPNVLAPGAQFTLTVTFTPSAVGLRTTTLRVLSDDASKGTFDAALSGTGEDPEITMFKGIGTNAANAITDNGPAIVLPTILARSGVTQFFTIQNTGTGDLSNISYSVTGGDPGDFTLTVPPLTSLGPDIAVSFSVAFRPVTAGTRHAVISIVSNDRDENPFEIPIDATAIAPDIVVKEPVGTALETGKIVVTGSNIQGQSNVPAGLFGVKSMAAGAFFTIALKADGTVAAWGDNFLGQTNVPPDLRNVTAVAAGTEHALALKSDGTVAAWGRNAEGQCNVPGGLLGVVAIAAGGNTSIALKSDGTFVVWGSTADGQNNIPAAATSGVTAIDAGNGHVLARKSNGSVVAWGRNAEGQATVPAAALANVKAISAGDYYSVALKTDGTIVAWGANNYGQCNVPGDLTNVDALSAGSFHVVALRNDGTIRSWGNNDASQQPGFLTTGYIAVAAGRSHTALLGNAKSTFPAQAVGAASSPKTFTIKNAGDTTLNLSGITINGGQALDFSVNTTGTANVLAPGAQTTFTATFTPGAAGPRRTTLRIANDDPDEAPFDIELTGTGAYPVITVEYPFGAAQAPGTGSVVLGNQFMGSPSGTLTFYIHNTSSAPLTINSVTTVGGNASEFTVSTAHMVSPVSVYTVFDVTFSSSAVGPRTTTLRVTSNDPTHPQYDLTLSGPGLTPVEAWRFQQFGNPFGNGEENDTADYDHDGIPNLMEYAFNLNPKQTNSASQLPQIFLSMNHDFYLYEFRNPVGVTGVTYSAEWSTTLAPNDWHSVPDGGNEQQHDFLFPITGQPKMFMRLRVTAP